MSRIIFGLKDLSIEKFELIDKDFSKNTKTKATFEIDVDSDFNKRVISILINYFLFKTDGSPLYKLSVKTIFEINPDWWQENLSDNAIRLPSDFINHIITISVSHTRGVLLAKLNEHNLDDKVMPLMDLSPQVQNMLITPKMKE